MHASCDATPCIIVAASARGPTAPPGIWYALLHLLKWLFLLFDDFDEFPALPSFMVAAAKKSQKPLYTSTFRNVQRKMQIIYSQRRIMTWPTYKPTKCQHCSIYNTAACSIYNTAASITTTATQQQKIRYIASSIRLAIIVKLICTIIMMVCC